MPRSGGQLEPIHDCGSLSSMALPQSVRVNRLTGSCIRVLLHRERRHNFRIVGKPETMRLLLKHRDFTLLTRLLNRPRALRLFRNRPYRLVASHQYFGAWRNITLALTPRTGSQAGSQLAEPGFSKYLPDVVP
jgi:hypothetical protein